jgi:RNA polymerase sigma-70 factor (ECF subfamily)
MNDEILKLYKNKFMFSQAMRLTKDRDQAHDLVQDTFIRVMDNLDKYEPRGTVHGYVTTVMYRIHLNNMRRCGIITRALENYAVRQDNPIHDATNYVYCKQLIKRSRYKDILKHRALGYTTKDVGKIMGMNENTVSSCMRYIREDLAKYEC